MLPFHRPSITEDEIAEVVGVLRSGWLTTGAKAKEFERLFAAQVGARHAVAVNSCTAALHLGLEAIGLRRGDLVLVPTMTFAATAEVVRYFDATPVFVDCDPVTLTIDVTAARATLEALRAGEPVPGVPDPRGREVRAIIPVHYGGQMADVFGVRKLAEEFGLRVIEDAAHTFPAWTRASADAPWFQAGTTAEITCFSFYANKCITTGGEGGMAVTDDDALADRMRIMSLHGMSRDAWKRFSSEGSWYYEIVAPGFKYNLTDLAAAMGLAQLRRAEVLWRERGQIAGYYDEVLAEIPGVRRPVTLPDRKHSWHLYTIRLDPAAWRLTRDEVMTELKRRGIGVSLHWLPLHLMPYYRDTYGTGPGMFPVAEAAHRELVTLPLWPGMSWADADRVASALWEISTMIVAGKSRNG